MRVLVLAEGLIGGGHWRAADAVAEALTKLDPTVICHVQYTSRKAEVTPFTQALSGVYRGMVAAVPQLWGFFYEQEKHVAPPTRSMVGHFYVPKLREILLHFDPDVVVCTHALPLQAIATLKHHGIHYPLVCVITDFGVHGYWIDESVDRYCVATPWLKEQIQTRFHVDAQQILVTGIPVHPTLSETPSQQEARRRLGLDDRPTALIISGRAGMGRVDVATETMLASGRYQVIAVAGKNPALFQRLKTLAERYENLRAYGYTDQVPLLMSAADAVLTKPGGLTSSEALALGRPLICFDPIPGQETRNLDFLIQQGAALAASTPQEAAVRFMELTQAPGRLQHLAQNAARLGRPHAAYDVAKQVLHLAQDRSEGRHHPMVWPSWSFLPLTRKKTG
ncbi:MAG: hypothetical protein IMW91_01830 [Firmicutes bacterium]|nr:hypothetical protein [Bacillota bacterium]